MPLPLRLSEPGPILTYLQWLRSVNAKKADEVIKALQTMLSTEDGAMFLDLLDKSTKDFLVPVISDPRAYEARNAQAFIGLDLRRILANETEQLLQRQSQMASRGRSAQRTDE